MPSAVYEKLESGPMFDNAIIEHHFTPYLRDYDIIVDVSAARPDHKGSYVEGRYLYRFTHCPIANVVTAVTDAAWRDSWDDVFIDYRIWEQAGKPRGYVWGVCYSEAYPGLTCVEGSALAREWTERFGKPMYEVLIETNGYNIQLVFHDVMIKKIAQGNPNTDELTPL